MVTITVTDFNEKPELMLIGGGTTTSAKAGVVMDSDQSTTGRHDSGRAVRDDDRKPVVVDTVWCGREQLLHQQWRRPELQVRAGLREPRDANGDNVYMVTVMANNGNGGAELAVTVNVTNDTSDDETTTPTPGAFDPWSYDADDSGTIEKPEMINAINDYLFGTGTIEKSEMIQVINLYLFGS